MSQNQEDLLREILRWLKFSGMQDARDIIDVTLTFEGNDRKERDSRIAYELTDGDHSQREIGKRISYSYRSVGNWQDKWSKLGIVEENSQGRYEHLISLEELGLDCPNIPEADDEGDESTESEENESKDSDEKDEGLDKKENAVIEAEEAEIQEGDNQATLGAVSKDEE